MILLVNKVIEKLKQSEEKQSIRELFLTIEGEIVDLVSKCLLVLVELFKKRVS